MENRVTSTEKNASCDVKRKPKAMRKLLILLVLVRKKRPFVVQKFMHLIRLVCLLAGPPRARAIPINQSSANVNLYLQMNEDGKPSSELFLMCMPLMTLQLQEKKRSKMEKNKPKQPNDNDTLLQFNRIMQLTM